MCNSNYSVCTVQEAVCYEHATGKLQFKLTNDYLFRAIFQGNKKALKGLTSAVLGIKPEEIKTIEVLNPIELGNSIKSKDFVLDIRMILNNNVVINMEMQILNLGNWKERSLAYLCRSFDSLNNGQDYSEVKPVIQVCFLDFTLFKEYPEFFATYMFMNVKKHIIYSDKLKLLVIDLTQIDKAEEEDKATGIDHWAKLMKAATWEEVKMLTMNDEYMQETAETAFRLTEEQRIRMQCQDREDYYRQQRYIQYRLEKAEEINRRAERILAESEKYQAESEKYQAELEKYKAEVEKMKKDYDYLEKINRERENEILLLKSQMKDSAE